MRRSSLNAEVRAAATGDSRVADLIAGNADSSDHSSRASKKCCHRHHSLQGLIAASTKASQFACGQHVWYALGVGAFPRNEFVDSFLCKNLKSLIGIYE